MRKMMKSYDELTFWDKAWMFPAGILLAIVVFIWDRWIQWRMK